MKNVIVGLLLFSNIHGFSQIISAPTYDRKTSDNIGILEIERNEKETIIHLIYKASTDYVKGGWMDVSPSIKIKSVNDYKTYSLLRAEGVPLSPEKKYFDFGGQMQSFRLVFPKISARIKAIDILECDNANCFNFYGVSLSEDKVESEEPVGHFRRDYTSVAIYDLETEEWGEWINGDNTFVMNYNENGDIVHYKPNGKMVLYKNVSSIEVGHTGEGEKYQIVTALDEDGGRFRLQFFDDSRIGLKMMYEDVLIQFAAH